MSDLRFDRRVAVVTGAGSGHGQRHALLLAERGAQVVVNDLQADDAARVVAEIETRGGTAISNGDVVDTPEGGEAIVDAAVQAFGGVDIVVHQTGRPSDAGSSQAMLTDADPIELLAGLFSGYWLARAAWIHMRERHYGRIILSCSFDRSVSNAMDDGNTVASMGLMGLMNILKCEGPDHDIRVNMVVPTATGDLATASDVVAYLAHEDCVPTGEIFNVADGGLARMFMGVTAGYYIANLTTDNVSDRVDEYLDPDGFIVPDDASGEITLLMKDLNLQ